MSNNRHNIMIFNLARISKIILLINSYHIIEIWITRYGPDWENGGKNLYQHFFLISVKMRPIKYNKVSMDWTGSFFFISSWKLKI